MLCWGCNIPGVSAASQQTLFIVSGSPSNTMLGEVTKIICLELKDLWGLCGFAADSFYCLRLPIQYNAIWRGDQNTMLGIESPVSLMLVHAPRCFIVSCSPTNKICDQSTIWKVEMEWKVLCGTCCFVAKFFISGFPTYTMLGGG